MKSVVIVGASAAHDPRLIDYKDLGADIWSCNGLHRHMVVKPTHWFQLHPYAEILSLEDKDHIEWLKQEHDFPIYMQEHFKDFPSSKVFPLLDLRKLWDFPYPQEAPIYSCTFSYMIALAILYKYQAIAVHGVNLVAEREAWLEAPNFMLWVGMAVGKGIEVFLDGRLMEPMTYGYGERKVPAWAPEELAHDIIVDNIPEARAWRKRYEKHLGPTTRSNNDSK